MTNPVSVILLYNQKQTQTLFTPVFGSSELDEGDPLFVNRDDSSERPLSATSSSSLALATTRRQGSASNVLGSDTAGAAAADASPAAVTAPAAPLQQEGATATTTPPASSASATTARRGTKIGRFEQLVSQSFEENKKRSAHPAAGVVGGGGMGKFGRLGSWAARGRQAVGRVASNVVMFLNSRSTSMVRCDWWSGVTDGWLTD